MPTNFINTIINENCLTGLKKIPDNSIDCCVTSPPYYGLRDYGTDDQIGIESSPELFVKNLVEVFREVRRVLKPEGTLWLNLGHSYANPSQPGGEDPTIGKKNTGKSKYRSNMPEGLKPKDLIGIPWMVAFALRTDGWYLRQDIIWSKPNPMPESVTDRCTKSHEYIFLLSKSKTYFYDHEAIKQPMTSPIPNSKNLKPKSVVVGGKKHKNMQEKGQSLHSFHRTRNDNGKEWTSESGLANKRSVWTVSTKPFKEAHFATFPQDLIIDCIKAGCPEGGLVLDPFMGSGTTAVVAKKLNKNYVGFELNPEYIEIAKKRLYTEIGMFL